MELLKLAQLLYNRSISQEKKSKMLKEVDVNYIIPEEKSTWAGYTTLHIVVLMDDLDLTNQLLDRGAEMVKQITADGQTPLHARVKNSSMYRTQGQLQKYSLIDTLLSKQVEIKNAMNPNCKGGLSHLHIACIVNHAEAVEFFAEAKEPLGQLTSSDFYLRGYTPLHCAIEYSSVEAAGILLQHGADVTTENADGVSSLHLLIERTIDMNDFIRMGKHTLCMPYEEEKERLQSIITSVLETRAIDDTFLNDTGLRALHVACTLRDKSFLEILLKEGIDVNMSVKSESKFWPGWTPVHFAACFDIGMMMLLMQRGANILVKNSRGETALDLCAQRFTPADIQLILSVENEFKDIVLSDNSTKLSDLLIAMSDLDEFIVLLKELKNVNIRIPLDSPIWPGYNLLHLSLSLNEKTNFWEDFEKKFNLPVTEGVTKSNNCAEDEESIYSKRIELCLKHGCSVSMKDVNGQTPIHLAFSTSRKVAAEQLLSHSEDNDVDHNNLSHLHVACALGHLEAVKRYLGKDADVNSRVKMGFDWPAKPYKKWSDVENHETLRSNSTPLHFAVAFGHQNIVECLLQNNADIYAKDSLGFTPIHLLMLTRYGLFETRSLAKLLFEATPNLRDSVGAANLSHLHVAAEADNDKAVKMLLRNGAEVNRVIELDVKQFPFLGYWAGSTALRLASEKAVKSLLEAGADVHAKDREGVSALQHSLHRMSSTPIADFVRVLKEGRCDIGSCGITLLHVACGVSDFEWARRLIRQGADVNARITDPGYTPPGATPLHVAFEEASMLGSRGLAELVELLVQNGADVSLECDGSTPLHLIYESFGCTRDEEEALWAGDLLLDSHRSYHVNPISPHGFSYFHFACMRNNVDAVTKFLDHGVDVNASIDPLFADQYAGFTPLHFAMAYGSREVAYLLLERGADVHTEDVHGNRPLHTAIKEKFVDLLLIETILGLGVDIHVENLEDETLLYSLLKYGNLTLRNLEFFLNRGCSIDMLDSTSKFRQEIIGLIMLKAPSSETLLIFERLLQTDELRSAIQNGLNVIQSIVANAGNDELTVDDYLKAIELFINNGCDLDQQDSKGTPLHEAAHFYNLQAMNALLQLGADVKVVDVENESPFDKILLAANNSDEREMNVIDALASHVWKMRLTGIEVSQSNLRCHGKIKEHSQAVGSSQLFCQVELAKAKETEICKGLTVRDFLSELGAVAEYPRMCPITRSFVEKFFNNTVDLRREFPNFCELLAFQYKKALHRMELWQPAMEAMLLICQFELPYLCLEAILRYFTNSEVKVIIELAKELS